MSDFRATILSTRIFGVAVDVADLIDLCLVPYHLTLHLNGGNGLAYSMFSNDFETLMMVHPLIGPTVTRNHFDLQLNPLHFAISIWLHCSFRLSRLPQPEHLNLNHLVVDAHKTFLIFGVLYNMSLIL